MLLLYTCCYELNIYLYEFTITTIFTVADCTYGLLTWVFLAVLEVEDLRWVLVRDLMENLGVGETENGSHPLSTPRCGSFELPYKV